MPTPIHSTIRDTKRLTQILGVLAKYGFAEVIGETGLGDLIARTPLLGKPRDESVSGHPRPVRLRLALEELGPTFIKLGQVLSTRPDLVPAEYVAELRKLQSQVPTVPFDAIESQLDEELERGEVLRSIEAEPLAAASMAQTHRAVLADGTPVVLKVLRPGIESIIESDVEILRQTARLVERYFEDRGFSPEAVVREFAKQIRREVDLSIEARSTDRLEHHFRGDAGVSFARVHHHASSRRVLALDEVKGTILSDIDPDTLSAEQRRAVVENGTDAVFEMCLELGFFHADPHPGNIFVHDDGSITFIDCGMTGHVDERTRVQLALLVQSVVSGNVDRVIGIALELSGADPMLEFDRGFRTDVAEYVAGLHLEGASLDDVKLGPMLQGFFDLLRTWQVVCPADIVYLIKALATIEGVGGMVDPAFDLVGHVRPRLERLVRRQYAPRAVARRLVDSAGGFVDLLEDLPNDIRSLIALAKRRDFAIKLQHRGLDRLSNTVDRGSRTIGYCLVLAAMIIAGGLLLAADQSDGAIGVLSVVGFVALGFVGMVIVSLALMNFRRLRLDRLRKRE